MKILYLTPQPPFPPDQGTKLRNLNLLRIAAQAGHQVDVLTFASPSRPETGTSLSANSAGTRLPTETRDRLAEYCRRIEVVPAPPTRPLPLRAADSMLSRIPDLTLRLWSPAFHGSLRRLQLEERYDVVQAEGFEMGVYLRAVEAARTIYDAHNVELELQQRAYLTDRSNPRRAHAAIYSFIQWQKLRRWEARLCAASDAVLAVSVRDAATLGQLSGRQVVAVPNGIDLRATAWLPPASTNPPQLMFDGTMSFRPNQDAARWFCQQVMPPLLERRSDVRLWIVGRDPPPALVAYNTRSSGVAVTGEVACTEPYWRRAAVYVLPMRMGAGVRFKALEAMARGRPIVSTALGMEGTNARPGHDYLRAEQPHEFVSGIVSLLDDCDLARSIATNARKTVRQLDWRSIGPTLLEVYDGLGTSHS